MITIMPVDSPDGGLVYAAKAGDEQLGRAVFGLDEGTIIIRELDCADDMIADGLVRAGLNAALNRGLAMFESRLSGEPARMLLRLDIPARGYLGAFFARKCRSDCKGNCEQCSEK